MRAQSRLSSFPVLTMLRLRHSWTSWRRSRKLARLERERRRLQMLRSLEQTQVQLLEQLELETGQPLPELLQYPERHPKVLKVPPLPVTATGVALPRLTPGNGQILQIPEQAQRPAPAKQQLAQELGLLPSTPPSSES